MWLGERQHRHVLPRHAQQIDLAQVTDELRHAAEWRHRALSLFEQNPLATKQSGYFPWDYVVPGQNHPFLRFLKCLVRSRVGSFGIQAQRVFRSESSLERSPG